MLTDQMQTLFREGKYAQDIPILTGDAYDEGESVLCDGQGMVKLSESLIRYPPGTRDAEHHHE